MTEALKDLLEKLQEEYNDTFYTVTVNNKTLVKKDENKTLEEFSVTKLVDSTGFLDEVTEKTDDVVDDYVSNDIN